MRVDILDPPAYSRPYDDQLAAALGRARAEVQLLSSPFGYGELWKLPGYTYEDRFYRHAIGPAGSRLRAVSKLVEHVPDMLAYRHSTRASARDRPDVAHFQWLTVPRLDLRLLPRDLPTVLTIHDPLERGESARFGGLLPKTCGASMPSPIAAAAFERVGAVVVHSHYARDQVIEQHGLDPLRVHVIPHGALGVVPPGVMTRAVKRSPPRELLQEADDGTPVVLCFGLLRPYKGVETLVRAWRGIAGAQLWIVGRPMMDVEALRAAAPPGVQIVPRFATRDEEQALFERADIVVLPYHRSDRFGFSGVLATALGYGKAIVLSDVGGLSEVADEGAARLVPPGDADALHAALAELLSDPAGRERLAAAATHAAATTYSWDHIARQTLDLYATITGK
jgi:glycosyltransferase involved in cell wall biosynthesis